MNLTHRGLAITLADDDPRVPIIEALLFGRSLPAFEAMPVEPPKPVAAVEIAPAMRVFWQSLNADYRREFALLVERPYVAAELEKALGISQPTLKGWHSAISRQANRFWPAASVIRIGRHRKNRRYRLGTSVAPVIRALLAEDAANASKENPS